MAIRCVSILPAGHVYEPDADFGKVLALWTPQVTEKMCKNDNIKIQLDDGIRTFEKTIPRKYLYFAQMGIPGYAGTMVPLYVYNMEDCHLAGILDLVAQNRISQRSLRDFWPNIFNADGWVKKARKNFGRPALQKVEGSDGVKWLVKWWKGAIPFCGGFTDVPMKRKMDGMDTRDMQRHSGRQEWMTYPDAQIDLSKVHIPTIIDYASLLPGEILAKQIFDQWAAESGSKTVMKWNAQQIRSWWSSYEFPHDWYRCHNAAECWGDQGPYTVDEDPSTRPAVLQRHVADATFSGKLFADGPWSLDCVPFSMIPAVGTMKSRYFTQSEQLPKYDTFRMPSSLAGHAVENSKPAVASTSSSSPPNTGERGTLIMLILVCGLFPVLLTILLRLLQR